ncbi:MAG: phosphoribosylanthranilate isomerase [Deltaproteobacteria bacterium]|nr:phosphoribosylanthranilate isomerase [Deltaproteobacteria bacterium]
MESRKENKEGGSFPLEPTEEMGRNSNFNSLEPIEEMGRNSNFNSLPLIKFCGITSQEGASFARRLPCDFIGFIFSPESPRYIAPEMAASIDTGACKRVGVFVHETFDLIISIMEKARLDYAQFHGPQDISAASRIGAARVIRVIWPESYQSPHELQEALSLWEPHCAFFLFDSGIAGGGHGRRIEKSRLGFFSLTQKPSILAGGLAPDNIFGLWPNEYPSLIGMDFNSGVEKSPGVKDLELMRKVTSLLRPQNI